MSASYSRVLINGNLTPEVHIQRSVRQGDPLSMHLFVLYLHPLLKKLISICSDSLDLVVAYADDISVIVIGESKIERIKRLFIEFGECSGAVLNIEKTFAIKVGLTSTSTNASWPLLCDSVKILGVTFFNCSKKMVNYNWGAVIRKTSQLMWLFKARNLSLHHKVILVNVYITSRLWFMASLFRIPNGMLPRMTSQIGTFLWGRCPNRVAMEQIALPICKGGLNLHLPMNKCKALLACKSITVLDYTPYTKQLWTNLQNPPNLMANPSSHSCLRQLANIIPYIPENIKLNPSSKLGMLRIFTSASANAEYSH